MLSKTMRCNFVNAKRYHQLLTRTLPSQRTAQIDAKGSCQIRQQSRLYHYPVAIKEMLQPNHSTKRYFSISSSLQNVAAVELSDVVVNDAIVQNDTIPENLQSRDNLNEGRNQLGTNTTEDSAIEIVDAAIDDVLQLSEATVPETAVPPNVNFAPNDYDANYHPDVIEAPAPLNSSVTETVQPIVATEADIVPPDINAPLDPWALESEVVQPLVETEMVAPEVTALLDPLGSEANQPIVASEELYEPMSTDNGIVSSEVAAPVEPSVMEAVEPISPAMNATSDPLDLLSTTFVDPSLIPLPPLPPIAIPGQGLDVPFSELGLNSWWPPGWIQWVLEYAHTEFGLPWWSSITITAIFLRVVTSPIMAYSQRMNIKNSKIMPKFQELTNKVKDAKSTGDWQREQRAQNDLARFHKTSGFNPLNAVKAPVMQMPIFLSAFWAIRGMVNVPVESMKTEGLFWFTNLTITDPYFLLPLFNSLSLWLQLELGVEMAATTTLPKAQRIMMRVIPCVMFPFLCFQSSAVVLYWASSIWLSFALKMAFRWEPARKFFKIPKQPKKETDLTKKAEEFSWKSIKGGFNKTTKNFKHNRMANNVEKKDETMWRESGLKGVVKTYKHDPTKVKRIV